MKQPTDYFILSVFLMVGCSPSSKLREGDVSPVLQFDGINVDEPKLNVVILFSGQ